MKKQERIPNKIKEILRGKTMPTSLIHDALLDMQAEIKNGRRKPWKHTPSKQKIASILGSPLHPYFVRVSDKGQYPSYWTYDEEE